MSENWSFTFDDNIISKAVLEKIVRKKGWSFEQLVKFIVLDYQMERTTDYILEDQRFPNIRAMIDATNRRFLEED